MDVLTDLSSNNLSNASTNTVELTDLSSTDNSDMSTDTDELLIKVSPEEMFEAYKQINANCEKYLKTYFNNRPNIVNRRTIPTLIRTDNYSEDISSIFPLFYDSFIM